MRTLVTSDPHGYPLDKFLRLLEKAGFSASDHLYVIGDVIDRNNDGGIAVLRWIMQQDNVTLLRGNHEDMMLQCEDICIGHHFKLSAATEKQAENWEQWAWNGSRPTIRALKKLEPETVKEIFTFVRQLPLYKEITVNDKDFILVHAGLGGNFSPERKLSDYTAHELVWTRPTRDTRYFEDTTVILGHTPTGYRFGEKGKLFRTDTWIDIDTGAASRGGSPMILRLDDMQEFYAR